MEEKVSKRSASYARTKGHNYERKIIHELIDLGFLGLKSSRSESRNLDNDKIDISETTMRMPFYVQLKCTKSYPNVIENIIDCPRKDRPLVIIWSKQGNSKVNMKCEGEFAIMKKEYFYELIKKLL